MSTQPAATQAAEDTRQQEAASLTILAIELVAEEAAKAGDPLVGAWLRFGFALRRPASSSAA